MITNHPKRSQEHHGWSMSPLLLRLSFTSANFSSSQFKVLLRRSFKDSLRNRNVWISQIILTILCAVLIGTVFLQIGNDQKSTTRRQAVLFFCVINQVFLNKKLKKSEERRKNIKQIKRDLIVNRVFLVRSW